jgi:hypothetical protein
MLLTKHGNSVGNVQVIAVIRRYTKEHKPSFTKSFGGTVVLLSIIRMDKSNKTILQLVVPMLDKRISGIWATKLEQTNAK